VADEVAQESRGQDNCSNEARVKRRAMPTSYLPYQPEQQFLLPPSAQEWLPEGHLAYYLSDTVDQLDLSAFHARYADLEPDGLQWPCPTAGHPGTTTVHADGFLRGRGQLVAIDFAPSPEHGVEGFPYVLVTGRVLEHYNVGTMTRRTANRSLAWTMARAWRSRAAGGRPRCAFGPRRG